MADFDLELARLQAGADALAAPMNKREKKLYQNMMLR